MHKILIETSLPDLLIVLVVDNKTVDAIHEVNLVKKSEKLPILFAQLLSKNNLKASDIDAFYITLGPGSFMGSRVALMFARTICQITRAKLFTINSLGFISQNRDGKYYIDAKSTQSYQGIITNREIVMSLTPFHQSSPINYSLIIKNIGEYLKIFQEQTNILQVAPIYLKNPKVG